MPRLFQKHTVTQFKSSTLFEEGHTRGKRKDGILDQKPLTRSNTRNCKEPKKYEKKDDIIIVTQSRLPGSFLQALFLALIKHNNAGKNRKSTGASVN